jgi:hypothetical protein
MWRIERRLAKEPGVETVWFDAWTPDQGQLLEGCRSGSPLTLPSARGRLLAVFVDDLDRCSPTNVFQLFEAVKL